MYTEAMAQEILDRLAAGESLRSICKSPHLPSLDTVRRWCNKDEHNFSERYTRARDIGLDVLADEILAIADTPEIGETVIAKPTGDEVKRGDMIEHRRLKVDARKWYLSKLAPKRYGDKLAVEVGVTDGLADRLARARQRTE